MPLNFALSKRFGLRSLTGNNPGHDIGVGFEDLGADLDNINQAHQDFLQAGAVGSTDWSFTANINSGTGVIGSEAATGGTAWLPDPVLSGALMRTVTSSAVLHLTPGGFLPGTGKYAACLIELSPKAEQGWDAAATVTATMGTEKASQAEAEAAVPAASSGRIGVRAVIVHNNGGKYEVAAQRDRRPWARGAYYVATASGPGNSFGTSGSYADTGLLDVRLECSGAPLEVSVNHQVGSSYTGAEKTLSELYMDGASQFGGSLAYTVGSGNYYTLAYAGTITPAAGSHFFKLYGAVTGTATANSGPVAVIFREVLRANANNGTS